MQYKSIKKQQAPTSTNNLVQNMTQW